MGTQRYNSMALTLSSEDAHKVLRHLFGKAPTLAQIDDHDRRYAQALILSAAHASIAMGVIHKLWVKASSPTAKPIGTIKAIIKAVAKAAKDFPETAAQALDTEMYATILTAIAYKHGRMWSYRVDYDDSSLLAVDDASFTLL
jgi:hypothetical protein